MASNAVYCTTVHTRDSVLAAPNYLILVDEKSHTDYGYVTKVAIFENWRWKMAAILKTLNYSYASLWWGKDKRVEKQQI